MMVFDEVLSVRPTAAGTVQVRAGATAVEHERAVVCAGRETAALARSVGLVVPVRQSAHVRLAFPVRGEPPERLACLLEGSGAYGEASAYADPLFKHAPALGRALAAKVMGEDPEIELRPDDRLGAPHL